MARTLNTTSSRSKGGVYAQQIAELKNLRQQFAFNMQAQGAFTVNTQRVTTATTQFNKAVSEQKASIKDIIGMRRQLVQAYKEQIALNNSMAAGFTSNSPGRSVVDLVTARNVNREMDTLNTRIGYANSVIRSASMQTLNWGKNVQWTGRQISVGLGVPLTIAASAMGKLALETDKQLTRLQRVYNTNADQYSGNVADQMLAETELSQVRESALNNAIRLAKEYGVAVNDTLKIQANLGAAGFAGNDLQEMTSEVQRIARLGELTTETSTDLAVTLGNAFKMTKDQLVEFNDFANAVENSTSLSINDIAEALPRAGSAFAAAGVPAKDMVSLLVAMKQNGVDAAEGANALKSSTASLLSPTRRAIKTFDDLNAKYKTNIDITTIMSRNKGNTFAVIKELGAAIKDFDTVDQQKATANLFGTYQFNRMTAVLQNVGQAFDDTGKAANQTGIAMELAMEDPARLAAISAKEMDTATQSISGKFKTYVETIKGEMSKLGEPVLKVLNPVLNAVAYLIGKFNEMPTAAKAFFLIMAGFGIAIGPIIMLTGVFAQLFSNMIRGVTAVGGLLFKFKGLTAEQVAAQLASNRVVAAFDTEATAATRLNQQIQSLTSSTNLLLAAQNKSAATAARGFGGLNTVNGLNQSALNTAPTSGSGGAILINSDEARRAREAAAANASSATSTRRAAIDAERQAAASARTTRNLQQGAVSGGLMAAGMITMAASSSKTGDEIGQMLVTAGTLAFVLTAIPFKSMALSMAASARAASGAFRTGAAAAAGSFSKIGMVLKALGPALILTGVVVAVGAVALGIKKWYDWATKARREAEALGDAAEGIASAIGADYAPKDFVNPNTGEEVINMEKLNKEIETFKENNEDAYNLFASYKDDDQMLTSLAVNQGAKIKLAGGTVEQARNAIKVVLGSAGKDPFEIAKIMMKIKDSELEDPAAAAKGFRDTIRLALKGSIEGDKVEDIWTKTFFRSDNTLTTTAENKAIIAGQAFADAFNLAATPEDQGKLFKNFDKQLEAETEGLMKSINRNIKNSGISDLQFGGPAQFLDELEKSYAGVANGRAAAARATNSYSDAQAIATAKTELGITVTQKQIDSLQAQAAREKAAAQSLASQVPVLEKNADKYKTLEAVASALTVEFAVQTGVSRDVAQAHEDIAAAQQEEAEATAELTAQAEGYTNALKSTMENTMNDIYAEADRQLDRANDAEKKILENAGDAALSGIEARGEAVAAQFDARIDAQKEETDKLKEGLKAAQKQETKDFEKNWDKILEDHDKNWEARTKSEEDAFDARIDGIDKSIEAEQKAEEIRQRIFDAEQRRIERMAKSFTANADFNVALNSGNLDEASRVFNSAESQRQQWSVDDQKIGQGDASEKKIEGLNNQKEELEAAKEQRLKDLQEIQDAEKKALEETKDRDAELLSIRQDSDQKALDSARDRLDKQLAAEKKNASDSIDNEKDRQQKLNQTNMENLQTRQDAAKASLEVELRALKAYIPANETELNAHLQKVMSAYSLANDDFNNYANDWGGFVGTALTANAEAANTALAQSQGWAAVGDAIMAGISSGMGIDEAGLVNFLKTGVWPGSSTAAAPVNAVPGVNYTAIRTPAPAKNQAKNYVQTRANTQAPKGTVYSRAGQTAFHTGGSPGFSSKDRTGVPRSASLYPSEYSTVLKKNEFVVNEKATRANLPLLQSINSRHEGGVAGEARHSGGMGGSIGGMVAGVGASIAKAISTKMTSMVTGMATAAQNPAQGSDGGSYTAAKAGKYGGANFNAEQLENAKTIMNVGKSMGASQRDITIALMTAMQESTLKNLNYGDRDSVGLFQQRTSQGWGSIAQIMDPSYSAGKFYEALFKVKNRDTMSLNDAAQKVQRSGVPNAYGKWQDEAEAIIKGSVQAVAPTGAVVGGAGVNLSGIAARPSSLIYMQLTDIAKGGPAHRVTSTKRNGGGGSYHDTGRAADFGGPTPGRDTPAMLAINQFWAKYGSGLAELIYAGPGGINLRNGQPHNYSAATMADHHDHVHVAATAASLAKLGVPGLKVGGTVRYDNTLANLHKDERVLTAPLSAKLDEGIERFASGGNVSTYTISVDLRNTSSVSETTKADLKKAIYDAIDERQDRRGKGRTVK